MLSPAGAQSSDAEDEPATIVVNINDTVPDMVLQLENGESFEDDLRAVARRVEALPNVAWVAGDRTSSPVANLLIGFESEADGSAVAAVRRVVATDERADDIVIGGRAVSDVSITDRLARASVFVSVLTALAAGIFLGWLVRPVHGAVAGLAVLLSGLFSVPLGAGSGVVFDGSIATSAIPAVMAALLVSVFVAIRLLQWFADPRGEDLAAMIRGSVVALGLEVLLLVAGLLVAMVFLEFFDPGRSIAVPVFVGVITATLTTLAVMAPVLAALEGADRSALVVGDEHRQAVATVLGSRPNGRDLPLGAVLAFGAVFAVLAVLAVTGATSSLLLDESELDDRAAAAYADRMAAGGGDPTNAILARFPAGTDQQIKSAWLQRVSQLPDVGRIDTSVGRYRAGEEELLDGSPLGPVSALVDGDEAPTHVLVVPSVPARSDDARRLVAAIRETNGPLDARLSGVPVDAFDAGQRDRSLVWATVVVLTLVAAVVIYGLTGDVSLSATVAALRLLDALALVGLHHLVVGDVAGPALLTMVFVVGIGSSLYDVGVIRRVLAPDATAGTDPLSAALDGEGWAAVMAMVGLVIGSLGFIGAGVGTVARDGVVLALLLVVQIVVSLWLFRPALLGVRAVASAAGRPVVRALQSITGHAGTPEIEARWGDVIGELLHTEFQFQADPAMANMEKVFVGDTPLFRNAVDHHRSLADAGLRIVGRSPILRSLQVVSDGPVPTVNVTVDHPARQLIDNADRVVGVRKAERRTMMLWLNETADGDFRVADSVELGAEALAVVEEPPEEPTSVPVGVEHQAGWTT
ncbi:MAG: hypothetical protein AAGD35_12400 [Actinomycetota bacterium]